MTLTKSTFNKVLQEAKEITFCDTSEEINEGECFEFAKLFVDSFGGVICDGLQEMMSEEFDGYETQPINPPVYHCCVELDGRFYDSETPYGVNDWTLLPIFGR